MNTDRPVALNRARVLAVDDHAINRQFLVATLSDAVADLELAASGSEANELWRSERFDLVLMDLHLTDMDGVAAWAKMREHRPSTAARILALTADTREQQRERVQAAGFHGLLGKPIGPETLLAALQATLAPGAEFIHAAGAARRSTLLIDQQRAIRASGSPDGARSIQQALAEELERGGPALDQELAAGRFAAAAERLHQWRGACGYAGAGLLDKACSSLEDALSGDSAAACGPAYFELRRALEATCCAIRDQSA
jgi:CheY-like chemotaxis protein/HPt (histidine-containing phosphotransfer) domain-containing protein